MSKALHSQVESEIRRREAQRIKEEQEKALRERERCENKIFQLLDEAFAECLRSFSNYSQHTVSASDANYLYHFKSISKKMGFIILENCNTYDRLPKDRHYVLSIPPFQKGNGSKRSPAQKKLLAFERQLEKARKERMAELLSECQRVKKQLEEGNYKYRNGLDNRIYVVK